MKKSIRVFCFMMLVFLSLSSDADLVFKLTCDDTTLTADQIVTVHISTWADSALATGMNGLNSWQLSALVDNTGVVEVVSGSVVFVAPSPWSTNASETNFTSINNSATGGTGSIDYLRLMTYDVLQNSDAGVNDYTEIAHFDIKAIGSVGSSVSYTLGTGSSGGFGGILRDYYMSLDPACILDGTFNANDSQCVFTIVPEPTTLLLLSVGLGITGLIRRKQ